MAADDDWLLWQLADSGLPTGGFVASSGLEAALQTGLVDSKPEAVRSFVAQSVASYAGSALPFVTAVYKICASVGLNEDADEGQALERVLELDELFESTTANAVTRRASAAQGGAILSLYSKSFRAVDHEPGAMNGHSPLDRQRSLTALLDGFKAAMRSQDAAGHIPICFGLLCGYLDVSLEHCQRMFLFLFARSIVNAAVRLNAIGPYLAQRVLSECQADAVNAWARYRDLLPEEARQTAPLFDLAQGLHDRLYSRLFSS
ncbi:urease accessory protein UreF [Hyaloraphidium curvatum]|nr:urease accessory protein UreF [Hyaloraphidium curvatum]